jgi:hypothetical protein
LYICRNLKINIMPTSTLNVNEILPTTGTNVDVNGIVIKDTVNAAFVLYGGTAYNANTSTGSNTTVIGNGAMLANTGIKNTAIGALSSRANTSGYSNTALGAESLRNNTIGNSNNAIGNGALYSITTGTNNTAVGLNSLFQNNGEENVCIGNGAGFIATGSYNVIVGTASGSSLTTGNNNVCLGDDTQVATATTSNSITLGNSSHNVLRCNVTSITSLSDERDKKDIKDLSTGLEFVEALRPVEFTWNDRDEKGRHDVADFGFIAQDLKKAQEDAEKAEVLKLVYDENPEKLEASYGKLIPILVKAIQELSAEVKELKNK